MSSLPFTEYTELMSQMLPLFNSRGLWWKRCIGAGTLTGLTQDDLLPLLQNIDPIWTPDLLSSVIRQGIRFGTLKQFPVGTYLANAQMIIENPWNRVFLDVIPSLCHKTLRPVQGVYYT